MFSHLRRLALPAVAAPRGALVPHPAARKGMATLPAPKRLLGAGTFAGGLLGGMFISGLFSSSAPEPAEASVAAGTEEAFVVPPAAVSAEDFAPILVKAMALAASEAAASASSSVSSSASVSSSSDTSTNASSAAPGSTWSLDLEGAWRNVVGNSSISADYKPNGATAKRIASVTPYFPFKGIPRFYDIGGFLKNPAEFQLAIDAFVERYASMDIDAIAGFDARGFILGPPVALALKKPFIMLRKEGKMPNAITGAKYSKEYAGNDSLSIPRGSISEGDRVLLIDDLVATGGTLVAGIDLVKQMGGVPVEAACVVELKFLNAKKKFAENGHSDVPIWALMDENILTLDGLADPSIPTDGYKDDGEAH